MSVEQKLFDEYNGQDVTAYTIRNDHGMELTCIDYGCIITKVLTPDRAGNLENIVLGFDDLQSYESISPYFGAVVGRVAGRIQNAQFELDGQTYTLAQNNNGNHLHGGIRGFSHVLWKGEPFSDETCAGVVFTYTSVDGEEGYPGTVEIRVTYTLLRHENEFTIQYQAKSDKTTLFNVTNHSYFNLSGNLKRDVLDHTLEIASDRFLELDKDLMPTGRMLDVTGTVFDLRQGRKIREGAQSDDPQIEIGGQGYDHPFILNRNTDREIVLTDVESGRRLIVETDQVGVVLYTGNQLSGDFTVYGVPSRKHLGLCLETQGLPDAIHHPEFPSCILKKDETFVSVTKYKFEVM